MQKGIYFDAQQRRQLDANVYPQKDGLLIHVPGRELFWKHSAIKRSNAGYPGHLVLKHGDNYQPDTLDVNEADFMQALKEQNIRVNYLPLSAGTAVKRVLLVVLVAFLLFLGLLAGAWYLLVPKLTEAMARKVPREMEQKLARPMLKSLLATEEIDTARTAALNGFYRQHLVPVDIPVNITVVKSPVVNALAVPGGELVVYGGLLNKLEQPGQLLALLGHEAGHVQYRHSLVSLMRNLSGHLVLALLLQDVGAVTELLLHRAQALEQLAYSRELELEADRFGLGVLELNHYKATEMVALMNHLKNAHAGTEIPDFLSTHPGTEERIEATLQWKNTAPDPLGHIPDHDSVAYFWERVKGRE